MSQIRVCYKGEWYDVTKFDHPGGRSILAIYNGKNIDEEFSQAHATDEPELMMMTAKKNGEFDGIKFCSTNKKVEAKEHMDEHKEEHNHKAEHKHEGEHNDEHKHESEHEDKHKHEGEHKKT